MIFINSSNQTLYLIKDDILIFESKISTSKYGMGCRMNSFKTPTGLHSVSSMLGKGLPAGTLFKNRRPTEKVIKKIPLDNSDYITSRILRLNGLEEGKNKGGDVDSYNRYIYHQNMMNQILLLRDSHILQRQLNHSNFDKIICHIL